MKFLHEMIAKKRAQHQVLETGDAGIGDEAGKDLPRHGVLHEIEAKAPPQQDWPDGDDDDLFDDGSYDWDLEGIADEMSEDEMSEDDADEDVIAEDETAEEETAEDDVPADAMAMEAANAIAAAEEASDDAEADEAWDEAEDDDWDEDDASDDMEDDAAIDVGRIAAMAAAVDDDEEDEDQDEAADESEPVVLRDLIASQDEAEDADPAPAAARRSSLEESVEKLRIQRKIWDMQHEDDAEVEESEAPAMSQAEAAVPPLRVQPPVQPERPAPEPQPQPALRAQPQPEPPAEAPQLRRAGRVKTRILGFHKDDDAVRDPFAAEAPKPEPVPQGEPQFPVGWMVVVKGPGRGASFTLTAGVSRIGRGEDQTVRLDFGDTSISRDNHAAVAFDAEQHSFYIGHGGKANLVRLNDMPVLSTEPLSDGDLIRIGETTLQFVAFCGPDFSWEDGDGDSRYAAAE